MINDTFDTAKEAKSAIVESMINAGYRGSKKELLDLCAYKAIKTNSGYYSITSK